MGGSRGRSGATKPGSMRTNHRSWMTTRGLPKPRWMPGTVSSWWSPVHDVTRFISDCRRAASTSTAPSRRGDVFGGMCQPLCRASSSTVGLTKHDSGTPRALSSWKRREARSGTRLVYPPAGIAPLRCCKKAWWMRPFGSSSCGTTWPEHTTSIFSAHIQVTAFVATMRARSSATFAQPTRPFTCDNSQERAFTSRARRS